MLIVVVIFVVLFNMKQTASMINPSQLTTAGNSTSTGDDHKQPYWTAILGDICQLPSLPKATADPKRYLECVREGVTATDRKDLGIWLLRECLTDYEFVASARRCKTVKSITRQQKMCDGPNGKEYDFCPNPADDDVITVREIRPPPRRCECPNGEGNCVCPVPEIMMPVKVPRNGRSTPRSERSSFVSQMLTVQPSSLPQNQRQFSMQFSSQRAQRQQQMYPQPQQIPNCPCPPTQTNCVCMNPKTQQAQVFRDTCCNIKIQQLPPCQCIPMTGSITVTEYLPMEEMAQMYAVMDQSDTSKPPFPTLLPFPQFTPEPPTSENTPPPSPAQPSMTVDNSLVGDPQPSVDLPRPAYVPFLENNMHSGTDPPMNQEVPIVETATPSTCTMTTTQQQYCPQQEQSPVVQPQPCPLVQGGVQNAKFQGICSWMIDPLCQPAPNNLFCGRWQRMPCAPATVFSASAQVCVWDTMGQPGPLPLPTPPPVGQTRNNGQCGCTGGVQIGSCNQNFQCPGQSVCQVGQRSSNQPCAVCCYYHKTFH